METEKNLKLVAVATVTKSGVAKIPKDVLDRIGLAYGGKLVFLEEGGRAGFHVLSGNKMKIDLED